MNALTAEQANAVWDVLAWHAGACDESYDDALSPRQEFVFNQTSENITEYRFMGPLGFGGKFWNYAGRWYVTAYPEDMTPQRQQAIDDTNAALAALKQERA